MVLLISKQFAAHRCSLLQWNSYMATTATPPPPSPKARCNRYAIRIFPFVRFEMWVRKWWIIINCAEFPLLWLRAKCAGVAKHFIALYSIFVHPSHYELLCSTHFRLAYSRFHLCISPYRYLMLLLLLLLLFCFHFVQFHFGLINMCSFKIINYRFRSRIRILRGL